MVSEQAQGKVVSKAGLFQPAAILDLVIYHQESKNLQRLKEYNWSYLYQNIFSDVITHSIALFMIELLQKCLKQPEPNPELYYFMEDSLKSLDQSELQCTGKFPIILCTAFGRIFWTEDR